MEIEFLDSFESDIHFSTYILGIPVDVAVNIFINSFGSIQETTMVRHFIYLPAGELGFALVSKDINLIKQRLQSKL